jgi:hypothetical protein
MYGLGQMTCEARTPKLTYGLTRNRWLVVWAGCDNVDGLVEGEIEIFGQFLEYSGGDLVETGPNDFRVSHAGPDGDPDYEAWLPDAAFSEAGGEYLVVYQGDDNTGGLVHREYEVWAQSIRDSEDVASLEMPDRTRLSDMGPDGDRFYAGATAAVAAGTGSTYLVVWQGDDNSPPLVNDEFEIFSQLYTTVPPAFLPVVLRPSQG